MSMLALSVGTPIEFDAELELKDIAAEILLADIPYVSQRPYLKLCWAACAVMVMRQNRMPAPSLASVTGLVFGDACGQDPVASDCDRTTWPEDAYRAAGLFCECANDKMDPELLRQWLATHRPVQPYFAWSDGDEHHTALIVGVYQNGDVLVHDPIYGANRCTYDYVLSAYNKGSWAGTWYNIGRGKG